MYLTNCISVQAKVAGAIIGTLTGMIRNCEEVPVPLNSSLASFTLLLVVHFCSRWAGYHCLHDC